jgi:hypothetical protein
MITQLNYMIKNEQNTFFKLQLVKELYKILTNGKEEE